MKKNIVIELEYYEFQDLVKKQYGHDFSFVADQECGNDSSHQFIINGIIDDYEEGELQLFKDDGVYNLLANVLLNDLANRGVIEKGNYIISVCW